MKNDKEFKELMEALFGIGFLDLTEDEIDKKLEKKIKSTEPKDSLKLRRDMTDDIAKRMMRDIRNVSLPKEEKKNDVLPYVVKEALLAYKSTMENERKRNIDKVQSDMKKASMWIDEKISEDEKNGNYFENENKDFDIRDIMIPLMKEYEKQTISKSTYYTEKINEITFILEKYKFEDNQ